METYALDHFSIKNHMIRRQHYQGVSKTIYLIMYPIIRVSLKQNLYLIDINPPDFNQESMNTNTLIKVREFDID